MPTHPWVLYSPSGWASPAGEEPASAPLPLWLTPSPTCPSGRRPPLWRHPGARQAPPAEAQALPHPPAEQLMAPRYLTGGIPSPEGNATVGATGGTCPASSNDVCTRCVVWMAWAGWSCWVIWMTGSGWSCWLAGITGAAWTNRVEGAGSINCVTIPLDRKGRVPTGNGPILAGAGTWPGSFQKWLPTTWQSGGSPLYHVKSVHPCSCDTCSSKTECTVFLYWQFLYGHKKSWIFLQWVARQWVLIRSLSPANWQLTAGQANRKIFNYAFYSTTTKI